MVNFKRQKILSLTDEDAALLPQLYKVIHRCVSTDRRVILRCRFKIETSYEQICDVV